MCRRKRRFNLSHWHGLRNEAHASQAVRTVADQAIALLDGRHGLIRVGELNVADEVLLRNSVLRHVGDRRSSFRLTQTKAMPKTAGIPGTGQSRSAKVGIGKYYAFLGIPSQFTPLGV